jgi:hypothetical protein
VIGYGLPVATLDVVAVVEQLGEPDMSLVASVWPSTNPLSEYANEGLADPYNLDSSSAVTVNCADVTASSPGANAKV